MDAIELFSDQHRKRQYEFMHYRMGYNRRYAALHNCRNFRNYYFHGNRIQAHPKSRLININMEGSHMLYIILFLISIAGGYVAFRYISLLRALKQIQKELDVIQQDLSKNQMIHLPVPNNRLKELLITINSFFRWASPWARALYKTGKRISKTDWKYQSWPAYSFNIPSRIC